MFCHFIIHCQFEHDLSHTRANGSPSEEPDSHFQTITPFTGTDQFGRVTILARERALVGLEVARTDTGGEYEEHRPRFHGHF